MYPTWIKTIAVSLLAASALSLPAGGAETDSCAYAALRDSIVADWIYPDEYRAYIDASEELCDEGMCAEAIELLWALLDEVDDERAGLSFTPESGPGKDTANSGAHYTASRFTSSRIDTSQTPAKADKDRFEWRISATISYDKYDDSYLSAFDEDTSDTAYAAFDEIDEQPVNGNARLSLDCNPGVAAVEVVMPYAYVSNTRARGGLESGGSLLNRSILYDVGVEMEKRLGEDYGDSSDAVQGGAILEITSRPLNKPIVVSLPVEIDAEHYRTQRSQYTSFGQFRLLPTVELESRDLSRRLALWGECFFQKYHDFGREDDEIHYGPHIAADAWVGPLSFFATASYLWERYPNRLDPRKRNALDADVRAAVRLRQWLEFGLSAAGFWEREYYKDQELYPDYSSLLGEESGDTNSVFDSLTAFDYEITASYELFGFGAEACPFVEVHVAHDMSIGVMLAYERNVYPEKTAVQGQQLYDTLYISEAYEAFEPAIVFRVEKERLYSSFSVSYRREDVKNERYLEDNSSLSPSLNLYWRATSWLGLDVYAVYERRVFDSGGIENNISASSTVLARF